MGAADVRRLDLTGGEDDTFAPPSEETLKASTPLAELRAVLARDVTRAPVTLEVPERPGMSVTYDVNIAQEQMEEWRKRARRPHARNELDVDPLKLAAIVLANQARSFQMNGREVRDDDGSPLLFYSPELANTLMATSGWDCVRKLYGVDGHVVAAAEQIIVAAGYGEELNEADPTLRTR